MKNLTQSKRNSTTSFIARLFILILLASILSSCGTVLQVPIPTEVTNLKDSTVQKSTTQELTLVSPTEMPTEISTSTMISEPTATAAPEIEIVDKVLAEKIKELMPTMWFYNEVSKRFEIRNSDEFSFLISKRTRLLIYDKEGNEVGFARYFVRNSPDAQMTEYYSLTDISKDTVIPIRLYSQMGNYTAMSIGSKETTTTKQCMYGFVEEYTEFTTDRIYPQEIVDLTQKYAPDSRNFEQGEKMIEVAVLRALANITNESEDRLRENFQNGVSLEFETDKGLWVLNRGVNYIWSDSQSQSYGILNGELFLFNGFSDFVFPVDAIEGCRVSAWDTGIRSFLGNNFEKNFPETVEIYKRNSMPLIDRNTIQIPVIVDLRAD